MNALARWKASLRLRDRLILMLFALILLPFAVLGGYLIEMMSNEMEKQLRANARSTHELMARELDEVFLRCNTIADQYSNDWLLNHKLRQEYASVVAAYPLYEDIWLRFANQLLSWTKLRNITIYTENRTLASTSPYILRTDLYMDASPEWGAIRQSGYGGLWGGLRGTRGGSEYWSPRNQGSTSRFSFSYTRIMGMTNQSLPNAYVTVEVEASAIADVIVEQAGDRRNLIVEANGRPVTPLDEKEAADILTNVRLGEDAPRSLSWDVNDYIGWQTTLSNGWILVSAASLAGVAQAAIEMRSAAILGLVLIILLVLLLAFLWSHTMTRRMRSLAKRMAAFWSKDSDPSAALHHTDEIGLLERTYDEMVSRLEESIEHQYVQEVKRKEAELNLLHTQINPHFLYNTLSSIAWMTDSDSGEVVRGAIEDMANFYRLSLSKGRDIISLREELQVLNAYINLQKLRLGGRIRFATDVDELLLCAQIPRLTLQPLVENCLIHGPGEERRPIGIVITVAMKGGHVLVSVIDDGVGMDDQQLAGLMNGTIASQFGNGIGYANVHERLCLYFGPEYGLTVFSAPGKGTRIEVRLPFR